MTGSSANRSRHWSRRIETVCVIPARGGSKGIPRKNLQLVAGKPLLVYSIEAAQGSSSVTRVVVSTDDPEIGAVAKAHGAEVVWRPADISGDSAPSEDALLHVLDYLERTEGYYPDLLVFLQCTAPLTRAEDIDGAVQVLLSEDADTALAVTPFYHFLWRKDETGNAVGINHDKSRRLRRQEMEPQYLETGAIYVMRVPGFKKAKHRFFGKTALYVMPLERCWEIDEPVDLLIAEVLLREQQRKQKLRILPHPVAAVVLDFDGVITDNRVIVLEDGREGVLANRSDGWGIAQLKQKGIPLLVLSSEENPVVRARCRKLGIEYIHGVPDKLHVLKEWTRLRGIDPAHVVYVGNDVNDVPCLQWVGCGVAVQDAHPEAKQVASLILEKPGGQGAVRELVDLILALMEEKEHA